MRRSIRRAHLAVAAQFEAAPAEVWDGFAEFGRGMWDVDDATDLVAGRSRWVRRSASIGSVEEVSFTDSGRVEYRSRTPGGSTGSDLDGVVRVSGNEQGSLVSWSAELIAGSRAQKGRHGLRRLFEDRLAQAGGTLLSPLQMETYLSGYRPLARTQPDGARAATWSPSAATLLTGRNDAVLIDALLTEAEAVDLVDWIAGKGKRLTHVIITGSHADHFYGLAHVLTTFPEAQAVAVPAVAEEARRQAHEPMRQHWNSLFPDQLPPTPVPPTAVRTPTVMLEDHELHLFDLGTIAGRPASVVSVRTLDAIVGGDLVYNMVHPWLIGSSRASRQEWWNALDLLGALRSAWVVSAHRDPGATTDRADVVLRAMRRYLTDFDRGVTLNSDPDQLAQYVASRHPQMGNIATLQSSALSQYPGWRARLPHPDFPDLLPRGPRSI